MHISRAVADTSSQEDLPAMGHQLTKLEIAIIVIVCLLGVAGVMQCAVGLTIATFAFIWGVMVLAFRGIVSIGKGLGMVYSWTSHAVSQRFSQIWGKASRNSPPEQDVYALATITTITTTTTSTAAPVVETFEQASQMETGLERAGPEVGLGLAAETKPPSVPPPPYERNPSGPVPDVTPDPNWRQSTTGNLSEARPAI